MKASQIAIAAGALVVLAACGQPSTKPGLTGMVRTQFITGAVESCTSNMRASIPAARNITPQMITDYCTCSANRMADVISEAEVATLTTEASAKAATQTRVEAAAKACARSVLNVNI